MTGGSRMATNTIFAVFENFNEPRDNEPVVAPPEDESSAIDQIDEIRAQAWTEGYLSGRQERGNPSGDQPPTAKLLTSIHELESATAVALDAASLTVADLLVNTVIAVTSDGWSSRLLDRVQLVADRVKPALTIAPEFILRNDHGTEQRFDDISDLSRALDAGSDGQDVTIRWHRGEATISRMALLEDLREAFIPLSAGRINKQNARNDT